MVGGGGGGMRVVMRLVTDDPLSRSSSYVRHDLFGNLHLMWVNV